MKNGSVALVLFFLLLVNGCRENEESITPDSGNTAIALFELTETEDNRVQQVDVLAFKVDNNDNTKEYFAYRIQGENIVDNGAPNKKQFTAKIQKGGETKYRFVVLANCRKNIDDLGDIHSSALKEALLARLINHHEGAWLTDTNSPNYTDIPMWAESLQMYIKHDTQTIGGLFLLRMLARVDVAIDASIQSLFKLKSIRLYNYNTYAQIVPLTDAAHWNGTTVLTPTIPTIPGKTFGPILYDQLSTPDIALIKGIYLNETATSPGEQSAERTCLVLGGEYNNEGVETFYRIGFSTSTGSDFLDILRNHLYNIRISKVADSGHNTPDEAFNSQVVNMQTDITVWEEGGLSDVIVDGAYYSTISQDVFNFPRDQQTIHNKDNILTLSTNHPAGWSVDKIVDENDSFIGAQWLTLTQYAGLMNVNTILSILADTNISEADRTAFIHFKFGRIIYVVKVIQSTISELGLTLTDSQGQNINSMTFYSYVGGTVPAQGFTVSWVPISVNLNVATSPVGGIPFNFGSGDILSSGIVTDPTGIKSYSIQPPAMTQAEINADPFVEKTMRVDYTVSNGVGYDSKSLFLQQKNPAALPTKDNLYFMDGTEKFFTIRSNVPWKIEVTNDPNKVVQQLITTSGGFNQNKEEEKVSFVIIDNMTTFSIINTTVTFTIKSIDPAYPLPDTKVTLYCLSAYSKKTLLTIGNDPNGYGYNFSGTAASNKLITTTSNFGISASSRVKSQGFTIINGGSNPTDAQMLNWLITNPVDMVIIGYDNLDISTTMANYYTQYLQKEGVVLAFQDRTDATVSANFLKSILGSSASVSYGTGAGSVYAYSNLNNELLNGAFGDLRGKQWGEDASTTVRVSNVGAGLVDALSTDRDISTSGSTATAGYMTLFKHKTYSLVWAGDGGYNSNNTGSDLIICPFKLNASNFPIPKASYGRGTILYPVYNSVFTANAIAWGIKQAEIKRAKTFK